MFVSDGADFAEKGVGKFEPAQTGINGQGARTQTTEDRHKVSYGNVWMNHNDSDSSQNNSAKLNYL